MNDQLENRLSMLEKVQAYLALHATDFTTVPEVAAATTELNLVVTDILASAGVSSADITGYTVQKANQRAELKTAILKVSTGFVAFNSINDNPQEAEKADATPAMLDGMRDNDIYTYAKYLHTLATPIITDLADYGVTPADLTALNGEAQAFLELIQEPRIRIGERGAELGNLTRLFDKAMLILTNKLDKLMPIFRNSNPTVYDAYLFARSIDDTGAQTPPDYEANVPGNTIQLIANLPYEPSRKYRVRNTGTTTIIFSLSVNPAGVEGDFATITPGSEVNRQSSSYNEDTNATNLVIQNTEVGVGSYNIWLEE